MQYTPQATRDFWEDYSEQTNSPPLPYKYHRPFFQFSSTFPYFLYKHPGDCLRLVYHGVEAGFGGAFAPLVVRLDADWEAIFNPNGSQQHKKAKDPFSPDGFYNG
jgi:hypothetical protein